MKKKWVMANWKMNGSIEMVDGYISELQAHAWDKHLELVILPPMIYLHSLWVKVCILALKMSRQSQMEPLQEKCLQRC